MTEPEILEIAAQCNKYRFGSPELDALHEQASHYAWFQVSPWWASTQSTRRALGRTYDDDIWYVVVHEGGNSIPTFRTLNHIQRGQHVPAIYDIPCASPLQ